MRWREGRGSVMCRQGSGLCCHWGMVFSGCGQQVGPTTMGLFAAVKGALLCGPAAEVLLRRLGAGEVQRASVFHACEKSIGVGRVSGRRAHGEIWRGSRRWARAW